jgi:hypothetical protein
LPESIRSDGDVFANDPVQQLVMGSRIFHGNRPAANSEEDKATDANGDR